MSTETEIKFRIDDPEIFCSILGALNPGIVSVRHFEDNILMDFPDRQLRRNQSLLRVRVTERDCYLTFKGPPQPEGIFKIREELEIRMEDGEKMLEILERIGMSTGFRYQKYRREYTLEDIHVAVDETPIGNFVELEGPEERILALAANLGVSEKQFLRSSYYTLYLEYCTERGLSPQFMVFDEPQRS